MIFKSDDLTSCIRCCIIALRHNDPRSGSYSPDRIFSGKTQSRIDRFPAVSELIGCSDQSS